jgi:acid stress-induced BolA-like protein IbaG/YrbA
MKKKWYTVEETMERIKKNLANPNRKKRVYVSVEATKFVKTQISEDVQDHFSNIVTYSNDIINLYPKVCKQGLYPFSRIIPLYNMNLRCPIVKITPQNAKYLVSDYVGRYGNEIPFLKRWFPKSAPVKGELGEVVQVIVYTKEQLAKEGTKIAGDYGIVAINVEMKGSSPVTPQTMINNHMGVEFGGNGVELNRIKYRQSVKFWQEHAFKER